MAIPRVVKQPTEDRVYTFDYSAFPEIIDLGETITSAGTVAASPSGPTIGSPSVGSDNVSVNVRISGGTDGTEYKITNTSVGTSGSNTLEGEFTLVVRDL